MSDLISREAALRKMRDVLSRTKFMGSRFGMTYLTNCFNALLNAVKNAPTVDAAPVVHGQWNWCSVYGVHYYLCSNCRDFRFDPLGEDKRKMKYCPHCGARMDGDKREPLE